MAWKELSLVPVILTTTVGLNKIAPTTATKTAPVSMVNVYARAASNLLPHVLTSQFMKRPLVPQEVSFKAWQKIMEALFWQTRDCLTHKLLVDRLSQNTQSTRNALLELCTTVCSESVYSAKIFSDVKTVMNPVVSLATMEIRLWVASVLSNETFIFILHLFFSQFQVNFD